MAQVFRCLKDRYLGGARSTKAIYDIILITAALIGFQIHETEPVATPGKPASSKPASP